MADDVAAYNEACDTLRHYSTGSMTVRLAAMTEGLLLLGGWATAITAGSRPLAVMLPLIGVGLTWLLFRYHMGYFEAARFFYAQAGAMENRLFSEGCRPIGAYDKEHELKYSTTASKVLTLHAPFTLLGMFFALALIATAVWIVRSPMS